MRMLMGMLLILMASFARAGDAPKPPYQVGTIVAVTHHETAPGTSAGDNSYDVSVKVGNTIYVVLYVPAEGTDLVEYREGVDVVLLVRPKTITFNDILGYTKEVTILRTTPVPAKKEPAKQN